MPFLRRYRFADDRTDATLYKPAAARAFDTQEEHCEAARHAQADRRTAFGPVDLQTQLEEILDEVWRQELFERTHPFTCGVIREAFGGHRRRPAAAA